MDSDQVLGRIWAVLGKYAVVVDKAWGLEFWSWAAHGHLGRLLKSSWAVLGESRAVFGALGRLLGCLARLLDGLGRPLGALGRLWSDFGRQFGAKLDAKRHKVDPKTFQNRGEDGPRWR